MSRTTTIISAACISLTAASLLVHDDAPADCNPRIQLCAPSESAWLPDEQASRPEPVNTVVADQSVIGSTVFLSARTSIKVSSLGAMRIT